MSTSTTPATSRPWRTAALAGMASYLDAGAIVSTGIALVLYSQALGLNEWHIGALSGLLTFSFAIGALFGGRLGDRFGRRRVFTVTLIAFTLGLLLLTFAVTIPMLFIGVIVVGLSIGSDLPVSLALAAEEAPEGKKGKMVALSGVLWMGGIAASVIIATFVGGLGELGGRILYGHLLLVALIVLVLRSRLKESTEWTAAHTAAIAVAATGDTERVEVGSLRKLMTRPLVFAVLATGLFYVIWNLGANTIGQFSTFLYVNIAGASVSTASAIGLIALPIGLLMGLFFMRVVDRPSRMVWFGIGVALSATAFIIPLVFGVTLVTLAIMSVLFGISTSLSGETIYKVWSQELFPTLLRGTAQGVTIAVTRFAAAGFAVVTPAIATSNVNLLLGILLACSIVSGAIGLFWAARLPKPVESIDELTTEDANLV